MRVFVNALSLGSLSGQHVLFGHVSQLAKWTAGQHEFIILHVAGYEHAVRSALPFNNVRLLKAPAVAASWLTRSAWEVVAVPRLIRRHAAGVYFTPAGTILPKCPVPQVSLAQNPWCLVPQIHRTLSEKIKAGLQRSAYRKAAREADLMVYNSRHIQGLYLQNARGRSPAPSVIAYQGINDETHALAERVRSTTERRPMTVVSVSAMAHWKGAETVVRAIGILRNRGIEAQLSLVGPWPDPEYEQRVRSVIADQHLQDAVTVTGKVSVAELHQHYATAMVYCLMSQCESFGIPAVEAQAFGTPVVGSSTCAMAEIGGDGGVFCPPGDPQQTASVLQPLLTDHDRWKTLSENAVINSQTYRWELCSRPLMSLFGVSGTEPVPVKAGSPVRK